MKTGRIILGLLIAGAVRTCAEQTPIVLENSHVRYSISPKGKTSDLSIALPESTTSEAMTPRLAQLYYRMGRNTLPLLSRLRRGVLLCDLKRRGRGSYPCRAQRLLHPLGGGFGLNSLSKFFLCQKLVPQM